MAENTRPPSRHAAAHGPGLRSFLASLALVGLVSAPPVFAAAGTMPDGQRAGDAAASTPTPADVASDMDFLLQAWQANALELGAARLALRRSHDVRVRQFARDLVREHSAASLRFQRLAARRGLGIPAAVRSPSPEAAYELANLRGVAFDRRFVARVGVQAHRDALALYRRQVETGPDRSLVRFASGELPMLRRHLARAEALQAQFELQRRGPSGTAGH